MNVTVMASHNVIGIHSKEEWLTNLQLSVAENKVVFVDFTATWCGPCKLISPHFEALSIKFPNVMFLKVDVDELQEISSEYEVRAMPTFLIFKDGKPIDKIVGADKNGLERKVELHATSPLVQTA